MKDLKNLSAIDLIPNVYQPSIYKIDYEKLYENGIRYGIFDVDCTLVSFDSIKVPDKLIKKIDEIKEIGITVGLCSSGSNKRVKPVADLLKVKYMANANKPFSGNFKLVKENLFDSNCNESNTMMVGDSFYLDMMFAERLEIYKVMVDPVKDNDGNKLKMAANDMIQTTVYTLIPRDKFTKGRYY